VEKRILFAGVAVTAILLFLAILFALALPGRRVANQGVGPGHGQASAAAGTGQMRGAGAVGNDNDTAERGNGALPHADERDRQGSALGGQDSATTSSQANTDQDGEASAPLRPAEDQQPINPAPAGERADNSAPPVEPRDDQNEATDVPSFQTLTPPPAPANRVPINKYLSARSAKRKKDVLAAGGGDGETEAAVKDALEWLKRNQQKDGSWSLRGPYGDGASATSENLIAATSMAMLAFLAAGNTPAQGEFKTVVRRGISALVKSQDKPGAFGHLAGIGHTQCYGQAQATIVVCELYGMTQSPSFRRVAQHAVDFTVQAQSPQGGWRYTPCSDSDTSVTGWYVMALQSAMMAELKVPTGTLEGIARYLDAATVNDGSRYGYMAGNAAASPSMTAEGLLCRQYLGWHRNDQRLLDGIAYLQANPMTASSWNVYYWYYATQVLHNMGGAAWSHWNDTMKPLLLDHQEKEGTEQGSWSPKRDVYGRPGGRLYVTCLCTWMLETYYRYLPIYSRHVY